MPARCDGCDEMRDLEALTTVVDYGNACHYCGPCREVYQGFVSAMQVEELRLQRQLDLVMLTARQRVDLLLMPMDLPRRAPPPAAPLRLG